MADAVDRHAGVDVRSVEFLQHLGQLEVALFLHQNAISVLLLRRSQFLLRLGADVDAVRFGGRVGCCAIAGRCLFRWRFLRRDWRMAFREWTGGV